MTLLTDRTTSGLSLRAQRRFSYLPSTALMLDVAVIVCACLLALVGHNRIGLFTDADITDSVTDVAPVLTVIWLTTIAAFGGYRSDVFGAGTDEFKRILNASMYAAGILGIGCYLVRYQLSRGFFVMAFVAGVPALLVGRYLLRKALHRVRVHGALLQDVVIAGGPAHVDEIAAVLRRERWLGYRVAGALVPSNYAQTETETGIPIVGRSDDHDSIVAAGKAVDVLFFTGGATTSASALREIAWDLEHSHVQLVVAPSVTDISSERVRVRPVGGVPLVHLEPPRWALASKWAKRSFDLVGSSLLIIACLPLIAYAALRIRLHDGGPVLFKQTRVGRGGETFGCFKFRTMVVNAESMVADLQAKLGVDALLFKMKDDPRITPPGKWLRKFSIDELPQLFNVWRGEMSLVGPRPQVPAEVATYSDAMRRRLHVQPGMTGLWQVSGRNDLSIEDSVRLDLYYIDNWSMFQDLSILAKTFGAVVGQRGAY